MALCPNGHDSADPDWCDRCGAKLGALATSVTPTPPAGSPVAPATGAAVPGSVPCPNCDTSNRANALFCEGCGYDFTTGQLPPPVAPPSPPVSTPSTQGAAPGATPGEEPERVPAEASPDGAPWVIEVSVDPEWYSAHGADSGVPCPAATSRRVGALGETVLLGRTSHRGGGGPQVVLDDDPGVSRRHAQLLRDAEGAWRVVDLGSTNGTSVGRRGAPVADAAPVEPSKPFDLTDQSVVYVGAWTALRIMPGDADPASLSSPEGGADGASS